MYARVFTIVSLVLLTNSTHLDRDTVNSGDPVRTPPAEAKNSLSEDLGHQIENLFDSRPTATKKTRSSEIGYSKSIYALVRAYTPWDKCDSNSGFQDGLTSTLKDTSEFPHHWGIAVDPSVIPYGTRIYVPGYDPSKYYKEETYWPADDTGSTLRNIGRNGSTIVLNGGKKKYFPPGTVVIELRFIHRSSARRWGTRWMKIYFKNN